MKIRHVVSVALSIALAATLSGCSLPFVSAQEPSNGRSGLVAQLKDVPEASDVDVVDEHGDPWTYSGPATGDATIERVSSARLKVIVDEVGSFLAARRSASVDWDYVTLTTRGIGLDITDRKSVNDEIRSAFAAIDPLTGFDYADIGRYVYVEADGDDVVSVFEQISAQLATYQEVGSGGLEVDSSDDSASFTIFGDPVNTPAGAISSYRALAAKYTIFAAEIRRGEIDITVAPAKVASAQRFADQQTSGTGIVVHVSGGASTAIDTSS